MQRLSFLFLLTGISIAVFFGGWLLASQQPPAELPMLEGEAAVVRFSEVLRIPDPNERAIQLAQFFRHQAGAQDAEELRRVLDTDQLFVDEVSEILFASWWAGHDPESALQLPISPSYGGREPWLRAILAEWTRRDPDGAIRAVADEIPPIQRSVAARAVILAWFADFGSKSRTDPRALLGLFPALEDDVRARGEAIDLILRSMLESRGVDSTIEFVEAISERPTIELRREFLGRLAGRISIEDPARAIALVDKHARGQYQVVMHRYFASQWGYHDGAAAIQWAANLPPETDSRSGTVLRAWRSWQKRDRREATEWMASQTPSEGIEPAYARYVGGLARRDPDRALLLLENVTGDESRRSILTNVGIGFMQRDPISGRAWMDAEDLPEMIRMAILDRVAKLRQAVPTGS